MVKHYVIVDNQDRIGFTILQSDIKPVHFVFVGSFEECLTFYKEREVEYTESQETYLC